MPASADSFRDFARVTDYSVYRPLPEGWWIGVTDVVDSTGAIDAGRYKAVNMAGASAISAVMNAMDGRDFPFAFGGDGAQLAVPPSSEEKVRQVLARTARWVADELSLDLRTALIPLADIRKAGRDVLVAEYAPSAAVRYAMFAGGGVEWAETQLKAGRYLLDPAPRGAHPDLRGLSCRWKPIPARAGVMLSVIVRKGEGARDAEYFAAIAELLSLLDDEQRQGNPVPREGPDFGSPGAGFDLEARASGVKGLLGRLRLLLWRVFAWVVVQTGARVGGFDPAHYREQTALNADYRKFHDGLTMTIDCSNETAGRIEALLERREKAGMVRYGLFRQPGALMTCIVPSYSNDNHLHFIDGSGGGYAAAARRLKQ